MDYSKIDKNQMLARELLATIEAATLLTKWRAVKLYKDAASDYFGKAAELLEKTKELI